MGIFKKLTDLARANLNQFIGQLEDPKKLAEQMMIDLREGKKRAEGLLITVTASLKSADDRLKTLPEKVAHLTHKAEDFLRNSDEESAKIALKEKQDLDHEIASLQAEITENTKAKESLKHSIKAVDDKISNLQSSSSIDASLHELNKEDAFSTFARMEEKIEAKEFEVAALNELLLEVEKNIKQKRKAFDKHSDPEALTKELEMIKKKITD
jgi:phage shock protein A